jgi:hypothetical protein
MSRQQAVHVHPMEVQIVVTSHLMEMRFVMMVGRVRFYTHQWLNVVSLIGVLNHSQNHVPTDIKLVYFFMQYKTEIQFFYIIFDWFSEELLAFVKTNLNNKK